QVQRRRPSPLSGSLMRKGAVAHSHPRASVPTSISTHATVAASRSRSWTRATTWLAATATWRAPATCHARGAGARALQRYALRRHARQAGLLLDALQCAVLAQAGS